MTNNEVAAFDEPTLRDRIGRIALAIFGGLLTTFSCGLIIGFLTRVLEDGVKKPLFAGLILAAAACAVALGLWMLRTGTRGMFGTKGEVVAPRIRRARNTIIAAVVVGVVLGFVMGIGDLGNDPGDIGMLGNGPVPAWAAITLIAVWLLVVPPITWLWHRSIDEHEAQAYRDGALVAGYAYLGIVPTWWIGWRGGFLPEPQTMPVFLVVMFIWTIVWFARRFG